MDNLSPTPEFEQKMRAAAAAPAPDPAFVSRLRAQVNAASAAPGQPARGQHPTHPKPFPFRGQIMRTRYLIPALVAVMLIAAAAFFVLHPTGAVSAQQILDRASAVQSAPPPAQGIWHTRSENFQDFQPLGGTTPPSTTTDDEYINLATNQSRGVTLDENGKAISAYSSDAAYTYSYPAGAAASAPLTILRAPLTPDDQQKQAAVRQAASSSDRATTESALFAQFRGNPRVELVGKQTWIDGSQAYVLIDRNYQTSQTPDGQETQTFTSSVKMIFSAQTFRLLASQTTVRKDGQDVLISSYRILVDEYLPAQSAVAWDLSDLPGAVIVDAPKDAQSDTQSGEVQFELLSEHELALRAHAYVLRSVPAGLTLKIVAVKNQPADEPYHYEVNYTVGEDIIFGLMEVGVMDPGFIETNFYDGSYVAANGMVLHYSTSSHADPGDVSTSAILVLPDGNSYLLGASLTRAEVQRLVEDLVPVK
jgi:hypothetical protein